MSPTVVLLTDFSTKDVYAGVMAGVIHTLAPEADILDLTHEIPLGDVKSGAFMLWKAAPYFPEGTIFVAVVDPGVGGPRRALAAAWPERTVVGPDNGLISYLLQRGDRADLVDLTRMERPVSNTFHGRDLFAPAAARLAAGAEMSELGEPVSDPMRLPTPRLTAGDGGSWTGEVVHIDPFGNLVTSVGVLEPVPGAFQLSPWLGQGPQARLDGTAFSVSTPDSGEVTLYRSFRDVPTGSPLAYIGSSGLLELAVNQGNAAETLGLAIGDQVTLHSRD